MEATFPLDQIWAVIHGIVMVVGAAVGAFIAGPVAKGAALVRRKEVAAARPGFSGRATGGAIGAGLAYALLGGPGGGFGFGPGDGGVPGAGPGPGPGGGQQVANATFPADTERPASTAVGTAARPPAERRVVRILLLGDKTTPRFQPPSQVFAFADDAQPKAVGVTEIIDRLRQHPEGLSMVELVLAPDPKNPGGSLSTMLENAHPFLVDLQQRVNKEAHLPFRQPDPADPFTKKIVYGPER